MNQPFASPSLSRLSGIALFAFGQGMADALNHRIAATDAPDRPSRP